MNKIRFVKGNYIDKIRFVKGNYYEKNGNKKMKMKKRNEIVIIKIYYSFIKIAFC